MILGARRRSGVERIRAPLPCRSNGAGGASERKGRSSLAQQPACRTDSSRHQSRSRPGRGDRPAGHRRGRRPSESDGHRQDPRPRSVRRPARSHACPGPPGVPRAHGTRACSTSRGGAVRPCTRPPGHGPVRPGNPWRTLDLWGRTASLTTWSASGVPDPGRDAPRDHVLDAQERRNCDGHLEKPRQHRRRHGRPQAHPPHRGRRPHRGRLTGRAIVRGAERHVRQHGGAQDVRAAQEVSGPNADLPAAPALPSDGPAAGPTPTGQTAGRGLAGPARPDGAGIRLAAAFGRTDVGGVRGGTRTVRAWISRVWRDQGHHDSCAASLVAGLAALHPGAPVSDQPAMAAAGELQPWHGDEAFHESHRSALVRKDPEVYGELFPDVPDDLPRRSVGTPDAPVGRTRATRSLGSRPPSWPADLCWSWGCSHAARRGAVLFPGDSP